MYPMVLKKLEEKAKHDKVVVQLCNRIKNSRTYTKTSPDGIKYNGIPIDYHIATFAYRTMTFCCPACGGICGTTTIVTACLALHAEDADFEEGVNHLSLAVKDIVTVPNAICGVCGISLERKNYDKHLGDHSFYECLDSGVPMIK